MSKAASKRAKAGSGKRHDKHAKNKTTGDQDRAEPGSGVKHDKHAPGADAAGIEVDETEPDAENLDNEISTDAVDESESEGEGRSEFEVDEVTSEI